MLGLVITTHFTMYKKDFAEPTLDALQETVGGFIEHVRPRYLPEPFCILIDEEGKLKRKPVNPVASAWYGPRDRIVGTAIVMKDGIVDGERDIVGLTDEECLKVIGLVSEISYGEYRYIEMEETK